MENEKDKPTIVINDHPEQAHIERLKEKLRYKQALRENSRKIDHKHVRLNIQADALPTKTYFIMNALAAGIAGRLSRSCNRSNAGCNDVGAHFRHCTSIY